MEITKRKETQVPKLNIEYLLKLRYTSEIINDIVQYLNYCSDFGNKFHLLNGAQQTFYLVAKLESEINKGGFKEYYYSSTANRTHETVLALTKVRAHKMCTILKKANSAFPESLVPKLQNERFDLIQNLTTDALKIWSECDEIFFMNECNFEFELLEFVKNNIPSFEA